MDGRYFRSYESDFAGSSRLDRHVKVGAFHPSRNFLAFVSPHMYVPLYPLTSICIKAYGLHRKFIIRLLSKNLKIKIYRTIILTVVLYGCETWSLTLREERKLRVFENMVLRRIFGPRRDEVTGEWRRLHKEELNDLYSSPNNVRVIK